MVRLLLTGERGYLGSAVAARLSALGLPWAPVPGRLDLLAPASLEADLAIHCAGALRHQPERLARDNVQASARLAAALPASARIVFASSRSVYGAPPGTWCRETDALEPTDDYGRSKLAAEAALRASGRPVLCVRLSTLFGAAPAGDCPSLPNQSLRRWRAGETVHLLADDMPVDYLAVQDAAARLVDLALLPQWPTDALNLPGPVRGLHALMQALATAARGAGLAAPLAFDHPGAARWPGQDGSRLAGWLPGARYSADEDVAADWLAVNAARPAAG